MLARSPLIRYDTAPQALPARILTALSAIAVSMTSEIDDWSIISNLARLVNGSVSV
jgi:hypothetical protein